MMQCISKGSDDQGKKMLNSLEKFLDVLLIFIRCYLVQLFNERGKNCEIGEIE